MIKDILDETISSVEDNIIKTHDNDAKYHPDGLGDYFYNLMLNNSSKIAQIDGLTDEIQTYEDLLSKCIKTSKAMLNLGILPGDLITPLTHNHLDSCIPFISSLFTGTLSAPLDLHMPQDEMKSLLDKFQSKIIFCSEEAEIFLEPKIKEWGIKSKIIVFGKSKNNMNFEEFLDSAMDDRNFEVYKVGSLSDSAYITLTGGSTGNHKAACISHLSLFNFIYSFSYASETNTTIISYSPLLWLAASINICRSINFGYSRLILPKFDPNSFFNTISKYNIRNLVLSVSCITQLLKVGVPKELDLSFIQTLRYIGSPLSKGFVEQLKKMLPNVIIVSAYGQSEVGGFLTNFDWGKYPDYYNKKGFSVGRPMKGITYKIVDINTGETLGPNKPGHLLVKTKFEMNGYFKTDSSHIYDENGWLKTGDVLYYDDDYFFYFVDRIKEMIRYKSWAISPHYLEGILGSHPSVENVFVTGVPHDEDGDHPVGAVVLKDGDNVEGGDLEKFVNERVDETRKIRGGVWVVDKDFIPHSATGKIQRYECRRKLLEVIKLNPKKN
nr:4-coumarate--CoA ligase 1-like [Onthophagus taurus]